MVNCLICNTNIIKTEKHIFHKDWANTQLPFLDFEFLVLESFQAGLNWITILKKRENFRIAFDHFDYRKIAMYNESKFDEPVL